MIKILKYSLPLFYCSYFKNFSSLKDNLFTISLLGKPNVGKSSLFNKLSGGGNAITDSLPGLTRDRKEIISDLFGVPVRLVDTAGLEIIEERNKNREQLLKKKMIDQTMQSLIYADLALFIIDVREGITETDLYLSKWLRKRTGSKAIQENSLKIIENQDVTVKKIILVGNKAEFDFDNDIYEDIYKLGFGDPIFISAEQGDGLHELIKAIENEIPDSKKVDFENKKKKRIEKHNQYKEKLKNEILDEFQKNEKSSEFSSFDLKAWEKEFDLLNRNPEDNSDLDYDETEVDPNSIMTNEIISKEPGISSVNYNKNKQIQISIVGKSNVGKSSLVNCLLKENRVIVDDVPGTTRDSISVQWNYKGKRINLVDTAGIDKSIKVKRDVDKKIHRDSLKSIRYSQIVICVIDAINAFRIQDLSVAQYVLEQGRGLILAVNKWDLVPNEHKQKALRYMQKQVEKSLNEIRKIPLSIISAKTGFKVDNLMDNVLNIYEKWNLRISTGMLNSWLNNFKRIQAMPTEEGNSLKMRFISQIKSRPPTFVIFVNDKNLFKNNYFRFMKTKLTEEFGLEGVPIRILIRDGLYKKFKKNYEKIEGKGKKIKNYFLKKRRLAKFAKEKIKQLNKQRKEKVE